MTQEERAAVRRLINELAWFEYDVSKLVDYDTGPLDLAASQVLELIA